MAGDDDWSADVSVPGRGRQHSYARLTVICDTMNFKKPSRQVSARPDTCPHTLG
jgi:hypothetical protein